MLKCVTISSKSLSFRESTLLLFIIFSTMSTQVNLSPWYQEDNSSFSKIKLLGAQFCSLSQNQCCPLLTTFVTANDHQL
uniref:Putative ovule protein n=1 Tax=Solanum chacoense TaxID=4108 RepID=A0A0V0GL39_SOLCH